MSTHEKTTQRTTKAAKSRRSVSDGRTAATHENGRPAGYSKAHQPLQDDKIMDPLCCITTFAYKLSD